MASTTIPPPHPTPPHTHSPRHLTELSSWQQSLCLRCLQKLPAPRSPSSGARALPVADPAAPQPWPAGCRPCPPLSEAENPSGLHARVRPKTLSGSDAFPLCQQGGPRWVHVRGCFVPPSLPRHCGAAPGNDASCPLALGLHGSRLPAGSSPPSTFMLLVQQPPVTPTGLPSTPGLVLWCWTCPHRQNLLPWSGCLQPHHGGRRPFRFFSL